MSLLKKLRKNKSIVLVASVIVVSLVYAGVQKAIDDYQFNNDIAEEWNEGDEANDLEEVNESEFAGNFSDGKIASEETELVMEENGEEAGLDDVSAEEKNGEGTSENGESSDGADHDGGSSEGANSEKNKVYIYITGEVNVPGVIILNEGSRIVDAINAAGGTTSKANLSKVNLVYVLEDGMKVNIPNDNDLKNNSDFEYITMNSGDGGKDDYSGNNGEDSSASSSSSGKSKNYEVININTATQTELETLPGIGPSLALKIINYRKENGKFSSIEDVKNVSGIGESKFENLKKYITV